MKRYAVDVYVKVAKTFTVDAKCALAAKAEVEGEVDGLLALCRHTLAPLQRAGFEVCEDDSEMAFG